MDDKSTIILASKLGLFGRLAVCSAGGRRPTVQWWWLRCSGESQLRRPAGSLDRQASLVATQQEHGLSVKICQSCLPVAGNRKGSESSLLRMESVIRFSIPELKELLKYGGKDVTGRKRHSEYLQSALTMIASDPDKNRFTPKIESLNKKVPCFLLWLLPGSWSLVLHLLHQSHQSSLQSLTQSLTSLL